MASRFAGPLGLAALGALFVADVALVGLAVRSTSATPVTESRPVGESGLSAGGAAAASPTTGTTDSAPSAPSDSLQPAPVVVGLVAVDDRTAWRFETGTCADAGSTLSVTEDGGETWQPRVAPFDVTVRVRVRENGSAFAIGADQGCAPRFRQSDGQGDAWAAATAVPGVWFRDPGNPAVVGTEARTKAEPCDGAGVVDLAVGEDSARALCTDGRVMASKTGVQWSSDTTVEGGLALALAGDRTLAVVAVPECEGLAVVDAGSPGSVLGCAPAELAGVKSGQVALAGDGDTVWLAAGSSVLRSSGDLADWTTGG